MIKERNVTLKLWVESDDTVTETDGKIRLANQAFLAIGTSGPTSSRPTGSNVRPGAHHVDTSLSLVVFWDGATWRNPVTGAAV